jgi:hypothetical protein
MFTFERLEIPAGLHKCLVTINLIETRHSASGKGPGMSAASAMWTWLSAGLRPAGCSRRSIFPFMADVYRLLRICQE